MGVKGFGSEWLAFDKMGGLDFSEIFLVWAGC